LVVWQPSRKAFLAKGKTDADYVKQFRERVVEQKRARRNFLANTGLVENDNGRVCHPEHVVPSSTGHCFNLPEPPFPSSMYQTNFCPPSRAKKIQQDPKSPARAAQSAAGMAEGKTTHETAEMRMEWMVKAATLEAKTRRREERRCAYSSAHGDHNIRADVPKGHRTPGA